jgi:hypothetical protein
MTSYHGNSLSYCAREAHVSSGLSTQSVVCVKVAGSIFNYVTSRYASFCLPTASRSLQSQSTRHNRISTERGSAVANTPALGAMPQGICHLPITPEDRFLIPGQFTRDLWCIEWHWDQISGQLFGSSPSVSIHLRSILTDSPNTNANKYRCTCTASLENAL